MAKNMKNKYEITVQSTLQSALRAEKKKEIAFRTLSVFRSKFSAEQAAINREFECIRIFSAWRLAVIGSVVCVLSKFEMEQDEYENWRQKKKKQEQQQEEKLPNKMSEIGFPCKLLPFVEFN